MLYDLSGGNCAAPKITCPTLTSALGNYSETSVLEVNIFRKTVQEANLVFEQMYFPIRNNGLEQNCLRWKTFENQGLTVF